MTGIFLTSSPTPLGAASSPLAARSLCASCSASRSSSATCVAAALERRRGSRSDRRESFPRRVSRVQTFPREFLLRESCLITRCKVLQYGCYKVTKARKRKGSGDSRGLQNRRSLSMMAMVGSTPTRFRQPNPHKRRRFLPKIALTLLDAGANALISTIWITSPHIGRQR